MNIFVSVASYRDPQLGPTLRDCIKRARHPDDLRFGICWQHGEDEAAPAELADRRMRVIDVPWRDSRGACWARAEIEKLWDGEDFFLQIDSHHRFAQDWDAILLDEAARSGAAKPVLSTYPAAFDPSQEALEPGCALQMDIARFRDDGIPELHPRVIDGWQALPAPRRARFVAAGFLFAPGSFVRDVPYDPDLYFLGEEITLAIRAYTHGYDLFHPRRHVLWHEYTRAGCRRHWDDHVDAQAGCVAWHLRDTASRDKVRRFLTAPQVAPFGCGTARSFAAYESYAGLSFVHCAIHDDTLRGREPPNAPLPPDWPSQVRDWQVRIVLERDALPAAALEAPLFWYVGFHDADNMEVYRQDASGDVVREMAGANDAQIVIDRAFRCLRPPVTWTVWPVAYGGIWLGKIVGGADVGLQ